VTWTPREDNPDVLETFKAGLSVGLIAMPREAFETCYVGEEIAFRACETARGHKFLVTHEPLEGCHHAEVRIVVSQENGWKKNDERDVADELWKRFPERIDFQVAQILLTD
jgi:hypothetical protein